MPRIARKEYDVSFFHIMVQGINKEYIFEEEREKKKYLELLQKYQKEYEVNVLAYCIMGNHAHLLVKIDKIDTMSVFMRDVNRDYAVFYNKYKKDRVGYVFRGRYTSEAITDRRYFINCINYIHLNPVKANIVEKCEDYAYSSYLDYLKNINNLKDPIANCLRKILGVQDYMQILKKNERCTGIFQEVDKDENEKIESRIKDFLEKEEKTIESIFEEEKILKKLLLELIQKPPKMKKVEISRKLQIPKITLWRLLQEKE